MYRIVLKFKRYFCSVDEDSTSLCWKLHIFSIAQFFVSLFLSLRNEFRISFETSTYPGILNTLLSNIFYWRRSHFPSGHKKLSRSNQFQVVVFSIRQRKIIQRSRLRWWCHHLLANVTKKSDKQYPIQPSCRKTCLRCQKRFSFTSDHN